MKTLAEMRNEISKRPPEDDLIQDLLPDSSYAYMLICGRSGIGKTFLALQILYYLAEGVPFLSHKTKQCKVGYLSMEGSDRKILNRFDVIGRSYPTAEEHIRWHHATAITLNEDGIVKLEKVITGLDVAIIDPLRPLVPGDYTAPKDANNFLKNLQKVQHETRTRLILIHHIRKPDKRVKVQPDDLQFEVKGASEYVEAASTVLLLERDMQPKDDSGKFLRSGDNKVLYFTKVKDAPTDLTPVTLRFNRETMLFQPLTNFYQDDTNNFPLVNVETGKTEKTGINI
ncbi:AAA family ATPase [Chloroflexota bacterium]